ncbi:MAG: polysaccharide deacetylase family protein [Hyphomicrobium sp.]|nr:polysaccharide deacetylase family protein [Hyphomicrobium sp.]
MNNDRRSAPYVSGAKRAIASSLRAGHRLLASRPLPSRLAIYFHELEPWQHPAFREALQFLTEAGYRFCDGLELAECRSAARLVYVSFDDNFASWHRSIDLLDALGVRATFYVNTLPFRDICPEEAIAEYFRRIDHRGERKTLTRAELLEIRAAGHRIGCHSHSHFVLSKLSRAQWGGEIQASKVALESILGEEIVDFSFPYGMRRYFSEPLRAYCRSLGFVTVANGAPGLQHRRIIDPMRLERTRWNLDRPLAYNLTDLRIDGRVFEALTGRSAVS